VSYDRRVKRQRATDGRTMHLLLMNLSKIPNRPASQIRPLLVCSVALCWSLGVAQPPVCAGTAHVLLP